MYLPSKTKFKYLGLICLGLFLLFFPFRAQIESLYRLFSRQLTVLPQNRSHQLDKLKRENLSLQFQIKKYQSLKSENDKLREALNFKNDSRLDLAGTQVISFAPSAWDRFVLVSSGSDQGIKKGLLALDEKGRLLGRVVEVHKDYSRIILISDPNFSLPVFVSSDNQGLLEGNLSGARILYIESVAKVSVGDKVWIRDTTLGVSVDVGTIKTVSQDKNSLFLDLEVELSAKKNFFSKVFIIK